MMHPVLRGGDGGDVGRSLDVSDVSAALDQHGYLADEGLATAVLLALHLRRPLLLEGDAGVGKTEVAKVLSRWTGGELVRLQCYEGIDLAQAAYEWDHARQLLHLRAAEAVAAIAGATSGRDSGGDSGGVADAGPGASGLSVGSLEAELYDPQFLIRRPLLRALEPTDGPPRVLLIDEIDRADDEFEAFLLEVLSDWSFTVPELGTVATDDPPVVVLTSNRTRDLHDALKRRCLYHWVDHPDLGREVAIVRRRVPGIDEHLAGQVAAAVARLRALDLAKPPGVAETIDWAESLFALGCGELDAATAAATLGALLKYREDHERVRGDVLAGIIAEVAG
jgi:MoxR-like ATPase